MVAARSRRDLLRVAGITVVGGASGLLAACGNGEESARPTKIGPADVEIVNGLVALEYQAMAAYRTGLPLLSGDVRTMGERFLAQEGEQVDALAHGIRRIGGTPGRPGRHDFPPRNNQADVLGFADTLETLTVSAYVDSIPKITDDGLRATAAAIMTTAAEHILVLREKLGADPLPVSFVVGQG